MNNLVRIALVALCGCMLLAGCGQSTSSDAEKGASADSASQVIELNDKNFSEQTAHGVVLVDFWAPWCGPCRAQGPVVEKAAEMIGSAAKVVKVNVDQAPQTAAKFGISSIPTLIVFKDGKPGKPFVGMTRAEVLVAAMKAAQ